MAVALAASQDSDKSWTCGGMSAVADVFAAYFDSPLDAFISELVLTPLIAGSEPAERMSAHPLFRRS